MGLGVPRAGSILAIGPAGQKWRWSWRVSEARVVPGQDPSLPALQGHDGADPECEGTLGTRRVPRLTPCPHPPRTQAVRIQDGRYRHPSCYTCADCGLSLKMRGHFWVGDELFCEKHARLRYQGPPGGPAPRPLSPHAAADPGPCRRMWGHSVSSPSLLDPSEGGAGAPAPDKVRPGGVGV
ncbi:PREDICTED: PDZ and LIM domain protein 2-like, partial [Corvus brachyrhynchos]|uniref:PDZ and LIM domain protein 2-like n=1 Tax=Corvus brachyrhynchos TaxID=85066 RepID=UPI0008166E4F